MAKAHYFNQNIHARELDILREHKDGTIDLGLGEILMVSKVTIVKEPKTGCAILVLTEEPVAAVKEVKQPTKK